MQSNKSARFVAAVLNFFAAPFGYIWLGAWRTFALILFVLLLIEACLYYGSITFPPGIYGMHPLLLPARLALGAATGVHAFVMGRRRVLTQSVPKRIILVTVGFLGVVLAAATIRGLAPLPVYDVGSDAMLPTLVKGDLLVIDRPRWTCGMAAPEPGDVVTFKRADQPLRYLQRVVAGPGDSVRFETGTPVINGQKVSERPILQGGLLFSDGSTLSSTRETLSSGVSYVVQHFPQASSGPYPAYRLAPNEWFIMGDNRDDAIDSRRIGPVSTSAICGVAFRFVQARNAKRIGTKP